MKIIIRFSWNSKKKRKFCSDNSVFHPIYYWIPRWMFRKVWFHVHITQSSRAITILREGLWICDRYIVFSQVSCDMQLLHICQLKNGGEEFFSRLLATFLWEVELLQLRIYEDSDIFKRQQLSYQKYTSNQFHSNWNCCIPRHDFPYVFIFYPRYLSLGV
jgi:hypothetical protein